MPASRLTVVHVASGDLWAGAEVQLFQLARELHRRGEIGLRLIVLNHGALADHLRDAKIDVDVIDEQVLGPFALTAQLRDRLKALQPRIIHSHRYKENALVAFASRGMPVVRVRTMHGAPDPLSSLRARAVDLADRISARFQHAGVCVSPELVEHTQGRFRRLPLTVIENGIDFGDLEAAARVPVDTALLGTGFRVGFAGRMEKIKRPDLFVATAHRLAMRAPREFSFHLFGDGPLMGMCREFAARHDLGSHLHLMGFRSKMAAWLARMDALVICSDHEGLPMVALEAMGLGVPLIAHAVGGIPHLLAMGEYGSLVREHSPDGYANALLDLAEYPRQAMARAAEARRHVRSHYAIGAVTERYQRLYRNLIATHRAPQRVVYD